MMFLSRVKLWRLIVIQQSFVNWWKIAIDLNIAFANELSLFCDNLTVDVNKVISLANNHPRVNILDPGIGVGGHSFQWITGL